MSWIPVLHRGRRRPGRPSPPAIIEVLEARQLLATVTVDLENFFFSPNPITIHVGDTVHWVWQTDDHSTTSVAGSIETWDSGVHNTGSTFDHTFTHPGTYVYYCVIHGQDNGNGTASGMSGTITVMPSAVTLQSITVMPPSPSVVIGQTEQFMAMGTFSDGSTQDITSQVGWTSSNTAAATINAAGLATGVAQGSSTITAALSGVTGTATLRVTPTPPPTLKSIVVTPTNPTVAPGQTQQFTATGILANNTTENLTSQVSWTSSKTAAATINAAGLATGVAPGSSTISAALGAVTGSTPLTVAFPSMLTNPLFVSAGLKIQATVNKTFRGFVAYFNAPNTRTPNFHAMIDWGDGFKPSPGHIRKRGSGRYAVVGSRLYIVRGTYPVTVTIRDALGRKIAANTTVRAVL
jgi:plastocyanin